MRLRAIVAGVVLGAVLVGGSALPAMAGVGDVIRRGACTGASDWKLKLSEDEISRIDAAFPVRRRRELPML